MPKFYLLLALLLGLSAPVPAGAQPGLPNPSAEHCEKAGYEYIIIDTPEGQKGECRLNSGEQVPAWDFYRGEIGLEYNYCVQNGYESRVAEGPAGCPSSGAPECVVCVLENGEMIEMADLIAAERPKPEETACVADGICAEGETAENCSEDCLADKAEPAPDYRGMTENCFIDGICSAPTEKRENCPEDCSASIMDNMTIKITIFTVLAFLILISMILAVKYALRPKKEDASQDGGPESRKNDQ